MLALTDHRAHDAAAQLDKNANDPKKKKDVINNLRMAINRGEIMKQQAAHEYDFTSKGHTGTSAGAYARGFNVQRPVPSKRASC
ncbi:hypothetical protein [Paraburkholderia sp. 2C]